MTPEPLWSTLRRWSAITTCLLVFAMLGMTLSLVSGLSVHWSGWRYLFDACSSLLGEPLAGFALLSLPVWLAVVFTAASLWLWPAGTNTSDQGRKALRTALAVSAVLWVLLAWSLWIIMPHRGHMSAATGGILLAPTYLLARLVGSRGLAAWVVTAVAIVVLHGARIVSGGADLIFFYLVLPPAAALITVVVWPKPRRRDPRYCRACAYDLTGNVSGICPECGTAIRPWS
jgi:hypothetical protein